MSQVREDPHAKSSVKLSLEEIKVLKDCRVNSVYYRGLPLGIVSVAVARGAILSGRFPRLGRWSGLFYTGMFGLGFLSGVGSYRDECVRKILALENSVLAEQYRSYQQKVGIPVDTRKSSEFDGVESVQEVEVSSPALVTDDDSDSPLMRRMEERQSSWGEIRQQSRQPYTEPSRGISYDDIRKQNRSNQLKSNDQTRTEEPIKKEAAASDVYTSQNFTDNSGSSSLDFSRDQSHVSYSSDDDSIQIKTPLPVQKKSFAQATGRKNQYGDTVD